MNNKYKTSVQLKNLIYNDHQLLHPPIELYLNETMIQNQKDEKWQRIINDPPFLVFDPSILEKEKYSQKMTTQDFLREVDQQEGLFYYLQQRPCIGNRLNGKKRVFRILICVTVYSESFTDLQKTLNSLYDNLPTFKSQAGIRNEDIAVVVMFDGCKQISEDILGFFEHLDEILDISSFRSFTHRRDIFLNKQDDPSYEFYPTNSCYVYQYHMQSNDLNNYGNEAISIEQKSYLQVFLAVKLQNNGKLSSHALFFRGFCETFCPQFAYLIDCGTVVNNDALYNCFRALETDTQIGGVCGYMGLNVESIRDQQGIRVDQQYYDQYDALTKFFLNIFNIQKAQKFEYSLSHILDKSFESLTGFIHVLPGAFSCYRWEAIASEKKANEYIEQDNMLEETYLISVLDPDFKLKPEKFTIQCANMMLAEDRILCLEIFCKKNFVLKYIPDAICHTDPIKYFTLLMKQRRRWINGSWFALSHVLQKFPRKLQRSTHSTFRRGVFMANMFISWLNQATTYIMLSLFYSFLQLVCENFLSSFYIESIGKDASLGNLVKSTYTILVGALFYISLSTKRVENYVYFYHLISTLLGIYMIINFIFYIYVIVLVLGSTDDQINQFESMKQGFKKQVLILVASTIVAYVIPMLFNLKRGCYDITMCLKDFLFYSPAYIHTLLIFAFCNQDDLSWGTQGLEGNEIIKISGNNLDKQELQEQIALKQKNARIIEQNFKTFKTVFVGKWLLCNLIVGIILGTLIQNHSFRNVFLIVIAYFFTINLIIRSISSIIFHIKYYFYDSKAYTEFIKRNKTKYDNEGDEMRCYIESIINKKYVEKKKNQQSMMNTKSVMQSFLNNTKLQDLRSSNLKDLIKPIKRNHQVIDISQLKNSHNSQIQKSSSRNTEMKMGNQDRSNYLKKTSDMKVINLERSNLQKQSSDMKVMTLDRSNVQKKPNQMYKSAQSCNLSSICESDISSDRYIDELIEKQQNQQVLKKSNRSISLQNSLQQSQ